MVALSTPPISSPVRSASSPCAYVPHTRSNTSNRALTFDTTVFPLVSLIDLTTQQHLDFHDGSAATLYDALTRSAGSGQAYPSPGSEHDVSGLLSEAEIQDLIAFLLALPIVE